MIALTETVRAFGKHAQRSQIAAEDQPDELQHEKQRHGHDLQLLDELPPEPVLRLDRSHAGAELSVSHAAGGDVDALFAVLDDGDPRKPGGRVELLGLILSD